MKRFADLAEQEILALAISNEEEDDRIYRAGPNVQSRPTSPPGGIAKIAKPTGSKL
jgi:hypothetical protein